LETARAAAVASTQASNVWRGVRDPAIFGLAQDNMDYPEHLGNYHSATTKTAADLETARAAAVASTQASNVWRGVRDPAIFGLAQDHKDYPEHFDEQNAASTKVAADLEAGRQSEIAGT